MPRGYDGEIRIDTRLDEKGFNHVIKNISSTVKDMGQRMSSTFKSLGSSIRNMGQKMLSSVLGIAVGFIRVAVNVGVVFGFLMMVIRAISSMVNSIIAAGTKTSALKEGFENLKLSVRNAFMPLLQVALPLLQRVAQWLTKIFNVIGQVMGALMGQRTVMRATADAASDAAGSTGKMAKNTKEAEKRAKGALAAFDEINVLEVESPIKESEAGGGGLGDALAGYEEVAIDSKILDFFDKLREKLAPLKEALGGLWDALKELWGVIWEALRPVFESLGLEGEKLLDIIIDLAVKGIEWLTEKVKELTEWIKNNQEAFRAIVLVLGLIALGIAMIMSPTIAVIVLILALVAAIVLVIKYWPQIKEKAIEVWNKIKEVWGKVGAWFSNVWSGIKTSFSIAFNAIEVVAQETWNGIKLVWSKAKLWFADAIQWISDKWTNFTDDLKDGIKAALNTALGWVEGFVNLFVKAINLMIGLLNKISIPVPDIPLLGLDGGTIGFNIAPLAEVAIPRLAKGAVIPPNSQFLAMLGDQRSGRNLEAPEDLIRQIVREETANQEITINFAGSMGALVREMKPYVDKENRRVGVSLVRGIS